MPEKYSPPFNIHRDGEQQFDYGHVVLRMVLR